MTITTTTLRAQYNGNGVTTSFAVPFEFLEGSTLKVILTDEDGVDTTQTITTHYTVTGGGTVQPDDGTVVMVTAPATGETLTILRAQPLTQAASYTEQGPFPAKAHEKALDRIDMQVQMISERVSRAMKLKETSANSDLVFPEPEADMVIGWNAAGTALENKEGLEDSVAAAAASAAAALVSQGAAAASATAAQTAETNAETAETNAETAETNAETAQAAAEAAQAAAEAAAASVNIQSVATRTALKAVDTSITTLAYLTEAGRQGSFVWRAGDYSDHIAADTQEGVYVKADAIAAASGAWVRTTERLSAEYFGASASASRAANVLALQCAVDIAQLYFGELFIPNMYLTDDPILVSSNIRLHGVSAKQSGISNNDGPAISLIPSTSLANNNTWYGFFNFSAISTAGAPGYGINYVSSGAEYLSNWIMEGVYASGVTLGALFDSALSSVGIFSCTIRRNWFDNGLKIIDGGDSITILENTVNGDGIAIEVDGLKSGARQLVLQNNNLTTLSECIALHDIVGAIIDSNWAETPSYLGSYTGTSDALVWLDGCSNTRITRNTIQPLDEVGGGFVGADYSIKITGTSAGNFIDDNDLADGVLGHINLNGAGVSDTHVGWKNRYAETAVITDTGTTTMIESFVSGVRQISTATEFIVPFEVRCTAPGAGNGGNIAIFRDSASPAASDGLGGLLWFGRNSAAEKVNYAYFTATLLDPTDGSEDGQINMNRMVAGTIIEGFTVGATFRVNTPTIQPNVNDATALGTGTAAFSDLFLGLGGVVNWNNGDYTITHSAGQLSFSGGVKSAHATAGIGYATGAGGTVTQITSKATGVTLSKASGQITTHNAALAAATIVSFTLTNTAIAAGDVLILNHVSGGTLGAYTLNAACGAGSATITIRNNTAGSLGEAMVISFALIKAVVA